MTINWKLNQIIEKLKYVNHDLYNLLDYIF